MHTVENIGIGVRLAFENCLLIKKMCGYNCIRETSLYVVTGLMLLLFLTPACTFKLFMYWKLVCVCVCLCLCASVSVSVYAHKQLRVCAHVHVCVRF